ncbi:hypothetical protein CONPUDRAFT_85070 [Coniophora puteana RWD-64-598 SS2]|uniref:Uncharacterized protein n=1 Tax=Coniophora puteana (strain RWD-64-598) TaxID=741705 RepID=A0A5M3M9P2_CONPW|nr:uncharacterized protein CONPUDRAFT_85070 [Coniophora puteana RWD-64-598 SS2]EIW75807.1 hypothetical protein CONPUDRAFT_85070 [Coniophora puteana RWD-64-598 SS2]
MPLGSEAVVDIATQEPSESLGHGVQANSAHEPKVTRLSAVFGIDNLLRKQQVSRDYVPHA